MKYASPRITELAAPNSRARNALLSLRRRLVEKHNTAQENTMAYNPQTNNAPDVKRAQKQAQVGKTAPAKTTAKPGNKTASSVHRGGK